MFDCELIMNQRNLAIYLIAVFTTFILIIHVLAPIRIYAYNQTYTSNNNTSGASSIKPFDPFSNPPTGEVITTIQPTVPLNPQISAGPQANNTSVVIDKGVGDNISSISNPPALNDSTADVSGVQVGDGQEIDTGSETEALTPEQAAAIKDNLVIPDTSPFKSDKCIPAGSLERFVPNPFMKDLNSNRFIVKDCVTVSGKVTWTHYVNIDGDANFNLKLDSKYKSLLTPANNSPKFKGALHVEVVCQGKNSTKDPVKVNQCKDPKYDGPNFKKVLPKVGKHVQVTGIYVIDVREGGHAELHPAYQIK